MKKRLIRRALALFLAMAALPSAHVWGGPTGAPKGALFGTGQSSKTEGNSNGMFNRTNASFDNEYFGGVTLTGFEHNDLQVTPIGGGLAVLLAAGAGYAALKRRKEERK